MTYHFKGHLAQSSMTFDPSQYSSQRMYQSALGIVVSVQYADNPETRTGRTREDARGWCAEATVYVPSMSTLLQHVAILPSRPSGLSDFEEAYPRATSSLVTGEALNSDWSGINPNDLDGDWCIVSFLNGSITLPYISNWWPHPRNSYDSATSGTGNPLPGTTKGTTLDQQGRYFRRINGVEYVVTKDGNTWISTTRAGSTLRMGGSSQDGRFPRIESATGGGIYVSVKPTEKFEITWDPQVDGIGSGDTYDPQLPQRNPRFDPAVKPPTTATTLTMDATSVSFYSPVLLKIKNEVATSIETLSFTVDCDIMTVNSTTSTSITTSNFAVSASSTSSISASSIIVTSTGPITEIAVSISQMASTSASIMAPSISLTATETLTLGAPTLSAGSLSVTPASTAITSAEVLLGPSASIPVALATLVYAELVKIADILAGLGETYVPATVAATSVKAI